MHSTLVAALVVMVAVSTMMTTSAQEELKYPERQVVAELAAQILRMTRGPWGSTIPAGPHKRNSELINSLLGLPKVMNDAGRR